MTKEIPATQQAVEFVDVDTAVLNPEKEMYEVGPRQALIKVEACGICFSDIKLINAFDSHPRKSEVVSGLTEEELAEIPTYKPGKQAVTPGHEPVGVVVKVGDEVTHFKVGDRYLIQADWRHLPTARSNAAFGYNFDGALQEYALVDERIVIDPATEESFLIPVTDGPSASAIALIEPWATVEASYEWPERQGPKKNGDMLVAVDEGYMTMGIGEVIGEAQPADLVEIGSELKGVTVEQLDDLGDKKFDDIVYYGHRGDIIEKLEGLLRAKGILNVVLAGREVDRKTHVDVGRIHYDLIRYTGTRGMNPAEGYARIPSSPAVRKDDNIAIIGAAGPMGLMHVVLDAASGVPGLSIDAIDVDDQRLKRLKEIAEPVSERHEVPVTLINSTKEDLTGPYSYVTVMVPVPALVSQAVDLASPNSVVNAFAGIPAGNTVELDTDKIIGDGVYISGTSGSRVEDMVAIKQKLEEGLIDTNVSLWAISGLPGVPDALKMVEDRTSGGKIVVYPDLADTGVVEISKMEEVFPDVAAAMVDGLWTDAAEKALQKHMN